MTSRIISINEPDLSSLPALPLSEYHDVVDAELSTFARKRAVTTESDTVSAGDVVRLSLRGPSARLTKTDASVSVGAHLLDEKLERELLGLMRGVEAVVDSSEGPVKVKITSIHTRAVPSPSDDIVREATDGRFDTVASYWETRLAEQMKEGVADLAYTAYEATIHTGTFELDPSDLQRVVEFEMDRCRALAAEDGLVFDELSGDELGVRVGVPTMEEFLQLLDDHARFVTSGALLGAHFTNVDPGDLTPKRTFNLCEDALGHLSASISTLTAPTGAHR